MRCIGESMIRRVLVVLVTSLLVAGVMWFPLSPMSRGGEPHLTDGDATVVAMRALNHAGLLGGGSIQVGHSSTTRVGNARWRTTHGIATCTESKCDPTGRELILKLGIDEGRFSVLQVQGDIPAASTRLLSSFKVRLREIVDQDPHWIMSNPAVVGNEIRTAGTWVGNIPSPGYGTRCRGVLESSGSIVWESKWMDMGSPQEESTRASAGVLFAFPPETSFDDAQIECLNWQHPGWRASGNPTAHEAGIRGRRWAAAVPVSFGGESLAAAFSACSVEGESSDGAVRWTGTEMLAPPVEGVHEGDPF
jgi:hypothetical protein